MQDHHPVQDVPVFSKPSLVTSNSHHGYLRQPICKNFGQNLKVHVKKADWVILFDGSSIFCLRDQGNNPKI
jgi:hypothetical protein